MSCCRTLTNLNTKAAPTAPFRRYRRSSLCRAPRKRTFIANMQKFVIEAELPSGLAGESFFGASTLCPITAPAPCCGLPQTATLSPMMILSTANGGNDGNGNGRGGNDYLSNGDGDSDASEQLSVLPLAVAVALCAALYPALEAMAGPESITAPKMQLAVVRAPAAVAAPATEEEELDFVAMHSAISAALLGEPYPSSASSEDAIEGKMLLQMA